MRINRVILMFGFYGALTLAGCAWVEPKISADLGVTELIDPKLFSSVDLASLLDPDIDITRQPPENSSRRSPKPHINSSGNELPDSDKPYFTTISNTIFLPTKDGSNKEMTANDVNQPKTDNEQGQPDFYKQKE